MQKNNNMETGKLQKALFFLLLALPAQTFAQWDITKEATTTASGEIGISDYNVTIDKKLIVNNGISLKGQLQINSPYGLVFSSNKDNLPLLINESNDGWHFQTTSYTDKQTPLFFTCESYTFQVKSGNSFLIKGGPLVVEDKITCKNRLNVTEINSDQIKTKDITVEMNQAADYVFDESYKLQPLDEVESYVKSNKHLPGIPSASEMATEGMSVSQMSNLLLEKVEELTLHMIQMQKKMEQLQSENNTLKSEMERMKQK